MKLRKKKLKLYMRLKSKSYKLKRHTGLRWNKVRKRMPKIIIMKHLATILMILSKMERFLLLID
jgi:hypothetical protein